MSVRAAFALAATLFCTPALAAYNVTISKTVTRNGTLSGGVFTPTGNNAVLNVTDLKTALITSDLAINTGTSGSQAGDINVNTKFNWPAHKLTLDAFHSVIVAANVHPMGTAGLAIKADDGGVGGVFITDGGRVYFSSAAQSLTINGAAYTLVPNIATFVTDAIGNMFGKFALMDNYDAAGGLTYTQAPYNGVFEATFEGLGNTISNFKIVNTAAVSQHVAFVGINNGTIRDINFVNAFVGSTASNIDIAVVVADNNTTISNVSVDGTVSAGPTTAAGGLTGASTSVSGIFTARILGCRSSAKVTGTTSTRWIGGLAGLNTGIIADSFATGSVSITAAPHGRTAPPSLTSAAGGLLGENGSSGSVTESYATGAVTGGDSYQVGGLAGWNLAVINNTYSLGSAQTGANGTAGGLVGTEASPGGIGSSYSAGAPIGGSGAVVGGFVGEDDLSGSISTSYWDTTTSGIANLSRGAGNVSNDIGIAGLSDTALKSALPSGFSSSIWGQSATINGGLPYLIDAPPP